jgi:GNAT superfamily N-acetyltransferase
MDHISLYGMYIKERQSFETEEDAYGFITYKINGDEVFVNDIFVMPLFRNQHVGTSLGDRVTEIAKIKGCKRMVAHIYPSTHGSNEALIGFMTKYKMRITGCHENLIVLKKEL